MQNDGGFKTHNIEINDRKIIKVNGVEKVKNINTNIFVGKVAGSMLTIQGNNLELTKLDLDSGEIEIVGLFNSLKYSGATQKLSLIKRIFK